MNGSVLKSVAFGALLSCLSVSRAANTPTPTISAAPADAATTRAQTVSLTVAGLAARIKANQITEGPWAGTFRLTQGDARLNWYFCNLALYPLVNLENYGLIRSYLNQYLNHVDPKTGTIQDFNFATSKSSPADSDDSYAATFLSLAVRYRQITNNRVWWDRNVSPMKAMARQVLLQSQKKSGLIRVCVDEKEGGQAYLMDNCEVYRGLKDFAKILREDNDPDAAKFETAASAVAKGIAELFDEETQSFKISDTPWATTFYPDRVGQVFPQLYGVPLGTPNETQRKYDAAWKYLNANSDAWETAALTDTNDKSLGGFPWMMLGLVATKRGDSARVQKQLDSLRGQLGQASPTPQSAAIHELGFALRIQQAPAQVIARGSADDQLPDDNTLPARRPRF